MARYVKSFKVKTGYQHREHRSKKNRTKRKLLNYDSSKRFKGRKEQLKKDDK